MNLAREIQQKHKIGETNFAEWDLYRQNLGFQTLDGSDFSQANLSYANLSSTSLKGANFHLANLSWANCFKADFSEANLCGTNLTAATLSEANFLNAVYDDQTHFPEGFDPLTSGAKLQAQPTEATPEPDPDSQTDFLDESSESFSEEPLQSPHSSLIFETAENSTLEQSSETTQLVSPAPDEEAKPLSKLRNKRKLFLILLAVFVMPLLGAAAFLIYQQYQIFQHEQSILRTVKSHRENQDYESCLSEINQAEQAQIKPTPFSTFVDQLNTLKETCQEKFAAQQMKTGTDLINKKQYEQAIATLSTIPETTESYSLAQSQITRAGQEYCAEIETEAKNSTTEDQFYDLIEKGQSIPTQNAIASDCKSQMSDLVQKWEDNLPVLTEVEALLSQGDCDGGRSLSKSLGKSIFRKWQQTSEQLLQDVADCQVPINISTTLQAASTHTFKGISGQSITIDLISSEFDTVVTLFDSNDNLLGKNDDGGSNKNSLLKFTLKQTGEFTVKVSSYQNKGTGRYSLKVSR